MKELINPTLVEVGVELAPWPKGRTSSKSPSWQDILFMNAKPDLLGEIRPPVDWEQLPVGEQVRVVLLESDGDTVLRWANTSEDHFKDVEKILGGFYHEYLVREGAENFISIKKGYIVHNGSGVIVVQS